MLYVQGTAKDAKTLPPGQGFTDPTYLLVVLDEDGERLNVRTDAVTFEAFAPLAEAKAKVRVRLDRRRANAPGAAWRLTAVAVEKL